MVSSLKNLCRIPGLIEILNQPPIKKEIFSLFINSFGYNKADDVLQRVVSEFLEDYNLAVKRNMPRHLILIIGFEMSNWAEDLKKYFGWSLEFSQNLIKSSFFTSKGLIDEEKAARELVNEPSFSLFLKYKIACQYFLQDIIPGLWQELRNNEPNFKEWLKENKPECPMVMWSNYLEIKNNTVINQDVETHEFKEKVFSYGLKNKNLAAVKFSYGPQEGSREIKQEIKMGKPLVYTSYCDFLKRALKEIDFFEVSTGALLNRKYLADLNIIIYFLSLMNKAELKEFFINFNNSINIVSWFLLWPYQNQFMDLAQIIWENFGIEKFGKLMYDIILIHSDKYMCPSYNYRLLLREFWIKSPDDLKEQIIGSEAGELFGFGNELIKMLYTLPNLTGDDLENIDLILKSANPDSRKKILLYQGNWICDDLILYHGNFTLANVFLESMDLDLETLQKFKKDFVIDTFPGIMNKQNINLFEEIFKWVVGNNEIDDFKDEIFHRLTHANKTEHLFVKLEEKNPFSFLKQTLKWFLKTDEKIVQWEKNIEYSPLIEYSRPNWFNRLLKYRGYSDEEVSEIKKNVLLEKLPEIAKAVINVREVIQNLEKNIIVLCSLKKDIFMEFTDLLLSFYQNSIKQKHCLLCLNNDHVYWNGEDAPLYCEHHGTNGIISLDRVDDIFSILRSRVERLLSSKEWVLNSMNII